MCISSLTFLSFLVWQLGWCKWSIIPYIWIPSRFFVSSGFFLLVSVVSFQKSLQMGIVCLMTFFDSIMMHWCFPCKWLCLQYCVGWLCFSSIWKIFHKASFSFGGLIIQLVRFHRSQSSRLDGYTEVLHRKASFFTRNQLQNVIVSISDIQQLS